MSVVTSITKYLIRYCLCECKIYYSDKNSVIKNLNKYKMGTVVLPPVNIFVYLKCFNLNVYSRNKILTSIMDSLHLK